MARAQDASGASHAHRANQALLNVYGGFSQDSSKSNVIRFITLHGRKTGGQQRLHWTRSRCGASGFRLRSSSVKPSCWYYWLPQRGLIFLQTTAQSHYCGVVATEKATRAGLGIRACLHNAPFPDGWCQHTCTLMYMYLDRYQPPFYPTRASSGTVPALRCLLAS